MGKINKLVACRKANEMELGSHEIPENRLVPNVIADVKKIYEVQKRDPVTTKDIAGIFEYKMYNTGVFYRRLNAMVTYGVLEQSGRGTFRISDLGEALAYPENDEKEKEFKTQAVLNVSLWKEIYRKYGKNPPSDSFWVILKNIAGIDPSIAKKVESVVRKWYSEDISNISEAFADGVPSEQKPLSSGTANLKREMSSSIGLTASATLTLPGIATIELNQDTIKLAEEALKLYKTQLASKKNANEKQETTETEELFKAVE
jgi:hypothetical protein